MVEQEENGQQDGIEDMMEKFEKIFADKARLQEEELRLRSIRAEEKRQEEAEIERLQTEILIMQRTMEAKEQWTQSIIAAMKASSDCE